MSMTRGLFFAYGQGWMKGWMDEIVTSHLRKQALHIHGTNTTMRWCALMAQDETAVQRIHHPRAV